MRTIKYALTFAFGILTGLAFNRLPHYQPFRNEPPPKTPGEWRPKMTGSWTEYEIRKTDGYFNGGMNV